MADGNGDGLECLFGLLRILPRVVGKIVALHIFHNNVCYRRSIWLLRSKGVENLRNADDARINIGIHISLDRGFGQPH